MEALRELKVSLSRGRVAKALEISDVLKAPANGVASGSETGENEATAATKRFSRLLLLCNTLLAEKDTRSEQLESLLALNEEKLVLMRSKLAASEDALARLAESKDRQARRFQAEIRVARAECAELRDRAMNAMALEAKISALEAGRERWRKMQAPEG